MLNKLKILPNTHTYFLVNIMAQKVYVTIIFVLIFFHFFYVLYLYWMKICSLSMEKNVSINKGIISNDTLILYRQQNFDRKYQLQRLQTIEWDRKSSFLILYAILVPEIFCSDLVRIGTVVDGGKWVCNPVKIRLFNENCSIYSLGINNELSFDEAIQNFTHQKCTIKAIDKDIQNNETMQKLGKIKGTFKRMFISHVSNATSNEYTFIDVVKEFQDTKIEILKIDIEGTEYEIIDQILSIPLCQILIEIHGPNATKTLDLIIKIAKKDFYFYSFQVNGGYPESGEYSFLHENCFEKYGIDIVYGRYLV